MSELVFDEPEWRGMIDLIVFEYDEIAGRWTTSALAPASGEPRGMVLRPPRMDHCS
jgi:hypothetical protein